MNRSVWSLVLSLLVLVICRGCFTHPRVEETARLAIITVASGNFERIDTPVSVSLEGLAQALKQDNMRLMEIKDGRRIATPAQIETDTNQLWWILSGKTAAQTQRIFELVEGQPGKTPIVEVVKNDSFLEISALGHKVLRYNHALMEPPPGADKKYIRSGFIHPLWSPKGEVLTDIHPADHIHHMGIWMPWTRTRFEGREVDFWNLREGQGTVRFVDYLSRTSGPVFGGFKARQEHVDLTAPGQEKVALNEVWKVRVYNVGGADKGYWLWDFVSTQRCASDSPLELLQYRYGGFGFRGAAQWVQGKCEYLTSEGKTRKDGHGTRARWCDAGGVVGAEGKDWAGVVFMSHPKNHQHPEPMRIWPEGQMFFNFSPIQAGDWTLMPGKDYVFRYRVYVHEGHVDVEQAERLWNDFAEPPQARLAIWQASPKETP